MEKYHKRWDQIAGIGIDMGVPYIEDTHISNIVKSFITELLDQNILSVWPLSIHSKGEVIKVNSYVGSPKMSSIARYLSQGVRLIATQRITQLAYNGTWSLTSENNTMRGMI